MYKWKSVFKILNLISDQKVETESISFWPSAETKDGASSCVEGEATYETLFPLPIDDVQSRMKTDLRKVFALELRSAYEIEIGSPVLLNEEELRKAGHPKPGMADIGTFMNIIGKLKAPQEIPRAWATYQKARAKDLQEILLPIEWYYRSAEAKDPLDQFINAWISFEALYGRYVSDPQNAYKGVTELISRDVPTKAERSGILSDHKAIINHLAGMKIIHQQRKEDKGQILRDALSAGEHDDSIFEKAILAIATLRNYIFHGNSQDRSAEARVCWPLILDLDSRIIKHELDRL